MGTSSATRFPGPLALSPPECQVYDRGRHSPQIRRAAAAVAHTCAYGPSVSDRYGKDVLSGDWKSKGRVARPTSRALEATPGVVVEDVETGWVGAVVAVEKAGGKLTVTRPVKQVAETAAE